MIVGVALFKFTRGQTNQGLQMLNEQVSFGQSFPGCREAWVAQSLDNSNWFFVFSRWESLEAYLSMEKALQSQFTSGLNLLRLMEMLEEPPVLGRYQLTA